MSTPTLDGEPLSSCTIEVPSRGIWMIRCICVEQPDIGARVVVSAGGIDWRGTVIDAGSGTDGAQRYVTIVGGAGGWRQLTRARDYVDDAGLSARLLVTDLCREAGEVQGELFAPASPVGTHYARHHAPAAQSLETVIGNTDWWLDPSGALQVGSRPAASLTDYTVTSRDVLASTVELALDDLTELAIGAVVTQGVDEPLIIRSYTARLDGDGLTVSAWCSPDTSSVGELASLVRALVRREIEAMHQPVRRYRVVNSGSRLDLYPVRQDLGLPPLSGIPIMCAPGIRPTLAEGTEVLIGWIDGDVRQPVVVGFEGPDGDGFQPESLVIGGMSGSPAARRGDAVRVTLPVGEQITIQFAGTGPLTAGEPLTGTISAWLPTTASGTITQGSDRVDIAGSAS